MFKQWIQKTFAEAFGWRRIYSGTTPQYLRSTSGELVTVDTALSLSAVTACVRLLSETVAALPLNIMQDVGTSTQVASGHSLFGMLHAKPNAYQTAFTFFQTVIAQMLLHGNSYAVIDRTSVGDIQGLWLLRPEGVTVEADANGIRYRYAYGSNRVIFDYNQILHFKHFTLDGINGVSALGMARQSLGTALAQEKNVAEFFSNGGRVPYVLKMKNRFANDEDFKKFRADWQQAYKQAHKAPILEDDIDYQQIGMSSADSQLLESRQFTTLEIARCFRVPPSMIGDQTKVSYSSSESEMRMFAIHSLVPLCGNIEDELNAKLFDDGLEFFAKFDVDSIVRGDQAQRYSAYSQGLLSGFLTVADVRKAEGLPYITGTDTLRSPANMIEQTGAGGAQ